jgi:hypothetical protein
VTEIDIRLRKLHPAQQQVRAEADRFNVLSMRPALRQDRLRARRGGRRREGLLEGYPVGWFAPNSRYFEEAWSAAVRILAPITKRKQEQKKRITLVNGAVFECWDLEDPDAGRSRKYGKVIVDEAAKVAKLKDAWEQGILPTLIDYGGNAWFLSSPKGFNFFKTLHDRGNQARRTRSARRLDVVDLLLVRQPAHRARGDRPHRGRDARARAPAGDPRAVR